MRHLGVALFLVFLSGMTALIYQITWQRYLATFLGSNALASSLILASFFLYMALGYFLIGRWSARVFKNKILTFAALEILIGIYGWASPDLFAFLSNSLSFHFSQAWAEIGVNFLMTTLFMGFPTFLMGGTLPVLTQGLVRSFEVSHKTHAWIYSLNTLGAFMGCLIAGFYLIERFGLSTSLWIAGFVNFFVALCAFALSRSPRVFEPDLETTETQPLTRGRWVLYGLSFLSGFYVFSFESLVIRMAALSLGPSTYTYTLIVASFILAIALGSFCVSFFQKIRGAQHLISVQFLLAVSVMGIFLSVPQWPSGLARIRLLIQPAVDNLPFLWLLILLFFVFLLVIPVGLMGMQLPLLFGLLKDRKIHLAETVGKVYALNALGCFSGALIGGYLLFLWMDAPDVGKTVLLLIVLSLGLITFLFQRELKRPTRNLGYISVGFLLVITLALPAWPDKTYAPSLYVMNASLKNSQSFESYRLEFQKLFEEKILYAAYGPNSHVAVAEGSRQGRVLYINGKPDAGTKTDDAVRSFNILFPLLYAPKVEEIFIIGLGAGRSLGISTLLDEVRHVDVVEMSEGVIASLDLFEEHTLSVRQRANKFKVLKGDAYKVLNSTSKIYNLIVSEPSNPWVEGVEKLFSREFLLKAKSRLSPDGYYTQWFPLFSIEERSLLSILKTFQSVFPWVSVWRSANQAVLIVAGDRAFPVPAPYWTRRFDQLREVFHSYGWSIPESLLARQLLSSETVRKLSETSVPLHTLQHPLLAYQAGQAQMSRQTVSLPQFLNRVLHPSFLQGYKDSRFLYENLPGIPPEMLEDSLGFVKRQKENQSYLAKVFHKRLTLVAYQKNPELYRSRKKLLQEIQQYQNFDPLIQTVHFPENNPLSLLNKYQDLKMMQKPVRLRSVLARLESCKTSACDLTKSKFLQALVGAPTDKWLPAPQRNFTELGERDRELTRQEFKRVSQKL